MMAQVDISGIKSAIKNILDSANTTTASPVDLSSGIGDRRVQKVMKVHPARIPIQPSFIPGVTIHADEKPIEPVTMARNQAIGKREAEMMFDVVGFVYEPRIDDVTVDQADENIEKLMENIEEIIRSNSNLSTTVDWCFPENVTYHNLPLSEETHYRVGIMSLKCKVKY